MASMNSTVEMTSNIIKYMSILNLMMGTPGLAAKLSFILELIHLLKYLEINYSEEVLMIFQQDVPTLMSMSYKLYNFQDILAEKEELV